MKAVSELYYGLELNDDAAYQLRVPRAMNAQAELRALKPQAGSFELAHKLITQDRIDCNPAAFLCQACYTRHSDGAKHVLSSNTTLCMS